MVAGSHWPCAKLWQQGSGGWDGIVAPLFPTTLESWHGFAPQSLFLSDWQLGLPFYACQGLSTQRIWAITSNNRTFVLCCAIACSAVSFFAWVMKVTMIRPLYMCPHRSILTTRIPWWYFLSKGVAAFILRAERGPGWAGSVRGGFIARKCNIRHGHVRFPHTHAWLIYMPHSAGTPRVRLMLYSEDRLDCFYVVHWKT